MAQKLQAPAIENLTLSRTDFGLTCLSRDPAATGRLGRALAESAAAGTVLLLCGQLGAGKTVLVQGLARGLGTDDPVSSPSFVLCNSYHGGRLPLIHLDLFRVPQIDLEDDGLDEQVTEPALVAIEWPGAGTQELMSQLPDRAICLICIEVLGPRRRDIGLKPLSDGGRALLDRLALARL